MLRTGKRLQFLWSVPRHPPGITPLDAGTGIATAVSAREHGAPHIFRAPTVLHQAGSKLRIADSYGAVRAPPTPPRGAPRSIQESSTGAPILPRRGGNGRAWQNRCAHEYLTDPRAKSPPSGSPPRRSWGIAVQRADASFQSHSRLT